MFKTIRSHIASARRYIKACVVLMAAFVVVATFPVQFVKAVSIYDGDQHYEVYSFSSDADSILTSSSIEVEASDKVEIVNNPEINSSDMTIRINRAFPIDITIGSNTLHVDVPTGSTVEEALALVDFTPDTYDEINHELTEIVSEGMSLTVKDVEFITETEEKTLKFKTVEVVDANMKPGERKVVREGKNGKETLTTFKKTVDGEITETSITKSTEKPVSKKVKIGVEQKKAKSSEWMSDLSPKKDIMLDKNGVPVNYSKKLTGVASAYCTGTTCSTGVGVKQGYIAVDPTIIPYGTEMYIRTPDGSYIYGYAVAADTGGFTSWGNTIADLYMYSYADCVNFGRRNIEIYIL